MNLKFKTFKKTAAMAAVFCLIGSIAYAAKIKGAPAESPLEIVKRKAINLLMQSQKRQAIGILTDYISTETHRGLLKDAREYRLKIAKKFLTKEAQEAYEMSLNLTIENPKQAAKLSTECLSLDPENLDCLIQRLRLLYRNQKAPLKPSDLEGLNKYFESPEMNWVKISSEKGLPDFKSQTFFKKESGKLSEDRLVLYILEIDRSLVAKNFSKAKEMLAALEKDHSDWPELSYIKNRIDFESAEKEVHGSSEFLNQYQTKCKNLNKSIARKYRYDFDLCLRGS